MEKISKKSLRKSCENFVTKVVKKLWKICIFWCKKISNKSLWKSCEKFVRKFVTFNE